MSDQHLLSSVRRHLNLSRDENSWGHQVPVTSHYASDLASDHDKRYEIDFLIKPTPVIFI